MGDLIMALVAVTIALGGLLALLGGLYWLSGKMPKKWQEGWRSWVFLFPAMVAMIVGLLVPAIRTIYLSLLEEIERADFQVLHQRIALTPLRKLAIAWRTWTFGPPARLARVPA